MINWNWIGWHYVKWVFGVAVAIGIVALIFNINLTKIKGTTFEEEIITGISKLVFDTKLSAEQILKQIQELLFKYEELK